MYPGEIFYEESPLFQMSYKCLALRKITPAIAAAAAASMGPNSLLAGQSEQEKVTLIMQVLQLSDEQLALLPEDQRRSIMILKEQLGKTGAI
ncbi:unnamed protein product [Schistosoma margrebowiei]|uniref:Transcription termination and cleavage factor C-terminal domain-containing protein n=1 Tax=Schistosoma margrebowiei TaxID=48269 RepID=A0AA85A949_9TREM|nr:unnamed protein product [Schistosoma margrebowiei]